MGGDPKAASFFIGIEGGGTRTVVLIANARGQILRRFELGPLNLKLASDAQILSTFRRIRCALTLHSSPFTLHALSICLAGCRTKSDISRLRALAKRVWPRARIIVGDDLDSGFATAFGLKGSGILVISGTGSCVYGRNGNDAARAGGWGHLLGDHGSGYWIALMGLQEALREYDRRGAVTPVLRRVLRRLCLHSPDQLVDWIQAVNKSEVATLAGEFLKEGGDPLMLQAASFLAMDCAAVAQKLKIRAPDVALTGGVFAHHRRFFNIVARQIGAVLPRARIIRPRFESAYGALLLATKYVTLSLPRRFTQTPSGLSGQAQNDRKGRSLSFTEQRNPRTMDLDRRSVSQLIDTMLAEESRVLPALRKNKSAIKRAIHTIVSAFKRGGRLFYVGAGTSGRIGVLDASECPPTFSTHPEMVQAVIAGGATALHTAVEGAEDDPEAGGEAIRNRGVGRRDVVVGITASGSAPFVLGALDEAKRRGAKTFLLCFSPPRTARHTPLLFRTGPEVITGSTRLKAGTATKLVLNMLTTISMIRLGKVVSNLMADVKPTNQKLRARACRIVAMLTECSEEEARQRLIKSGWNVKRALR